MYQTAINIRLINAIFGAMASIVNSYNATTYRKPQRRQA